MSPATPPFFLKKNKLRLNFNPKPKQNQKWCGEWDSHPNLLVNYSYFAKLALLLVLRRVSKG